MGLNIHKQKEALHIKEQHLIDKGYTKKDNFTYEKIDKSTGMTVELEFSKTGSLELNEEIENNIISIITRRDK